MSKLMDMLGQRPPGPLWMHLLAVLSGAALVGMVNHSFASQGGAGWSLILTLIFTTGYYGMVLAMLNARFGNLDQRPD